MIPHHSHFWNKLDLLLMRHKSELTALCQSARLQLPDRVFFALIKRVSRCRTLGGGSIH